MDRISTINRLPESVDRHWAAVVRLFFFGTPVAIFRGIRTVIVSTLYAVFWTRAASHLGKKISVIVPAWIDRYASAAVVFVVFSIRIFASLMHSSPDYPFWRQAISVFVIRLAKAVFCPAPTRFRLSSSKIATKADQFVAAIASTKPTGLAMLNFCKGNNDKAFKTSPCEVYSNSAHRFLMAWEE